MAQDKVKALYDTFVKEGYNMESEAEFRKNLADPAKRKAAYEALKKDGYEMEAYDAFETNIGYGKAQATSTPAPTATPAPTPQSDVKTTPAPAAPKPQSAPIPAPAPKATQPTWKPSEQDKIRMSWGLFNMLNDFRQQSQARIEQARRATMPMTTEGRRKLKAGKFQAQLAGTPTKMMGLTPNVRTAETATAGEGQGAAETSAKPMESAQSPVPYGVRYVNGKPVTEWLLPDGTLTTDLVEADKAEYGARTVRLRNQFVDRMKQNGLDPSKQEDVQRQSQIDAETEEAKFIERTSEDANNVVAELWQEAEDKHKADKNANADREWSRYAAMGGGREMRVVTASANRHADQVSHMTRFDLEKMMETTWARVGNRVTAQCYNRLRTQYPQATEEELQKAATDMARGLTDNAVFQYAVKQNTPKSTLEYFGRTVADANVLNSIGKGLARSQAGTSGDLAAYEQAMGEYGKNHRVAQIGGTVVGMAIDPVTYISGGMGSLFGKGAMWAGGRFLASRAAGMSAQAGTRLFSSSLSGRLLTGAAAGAGNFMTFETLKEAENQFLHGGHINERGENEGYSAEALLKSAGKGLILGGVTGTITPYFGNIADKAVKATESTAGKAGLRATELGVSTIAEGTVFAMPEWYENSKREDGDPNKRTIMDIWTDNMAMMLGFKVSHGIKSAPRVIASLRPIKPADGRPLTQAERNHNRMNFEERVRKSMDMSPNDLSFSDDEREELRRAGYGELADIFSRDREQTTSQPNPADGAIELRTERAEADEIRNGNPEFDGYSDMERLMQDGRVSQAARAKAYYVLTGRMLPMGTVTGWTKDIAEDGRVTINAVTADGEVVTSRTFANEKAAEQETNNISRQAELNSVEVGERYREALADEMLLEESISQISPGADMETVKRIYRAVKAGNKDMTEEQAALAGFIDEAIERNRDMADRHRPEAIRAELREEYGIEVDDALRKTPDKRTAKEKEIVQTYLERLFPGEARERAEEPTPEQEEAQGLYEEGKLLYGRYEEGDPNVTAEVDAIVIRMQEANQIFEDAFGAESEYYRFHLNENPWGLINDPALTAGQQDAVLYYINAKAALDGVMDASHETADRKRAEVEQSVAKRTHKDTGAITPATMKVNDRQVYIVKGDVAMYPDGSGVDAHNSSESIVVMDAESGEYEFTSPEQIFSVGENIDPEDEMRTALEAIEQERDAIFGENGVPPTEEPGETPAPMDGNNDPQNIPAEGNIDAENIPQTADTEAYDRGYEHGIKVSTILPDDTLNETITELREREFLSDEWRGVLEAYEYEQQRRAMAAESVPENAESVPNIGENTEIPTENRESFTENVPNSAIPVENGQETALSRIPLHEETGEPMFEAVEKELAWDGLVEAVGNDKDAADIALAQIEQANAELESLKKKPPTMKAPKLKGSPMAMAKAKQDAQAKYAEELADYNQRLADTQAKANAWTSILGVHRDRTSELRRQQEEERRQRDAELHDQAVAQFEEEMRLKAERDAEQSAIGTHAVNPKIKEKWDSANKVEGNADAITLPDGSTIRGRYVLTEAGAASASHDVNNAYEPTEGFPIDANGQSVNDRDYLRDKDAQRIVEQIAGAYDNRALQTPVIVSRDGVVLSGNNRTMSGDLAARQGTDKAYTDYLREFGAKYGFTPEQVNGMEHPRLVFVPDEALPYDATTFSRFNAQEMKSQSKPEAAVKLGKIVPDNVFGDIVTDIAKYDRLSDYYRNEEETAHALGALMQAGVINDKQMPEMRTGTALSAAGKELIENTLIGKVFQSSPDAVRQIISMPSMRETIVMGLGEIASNSTLGKRGYDLSAELSAAVDLVTRAKNASPDVYKDGMPVSPFGRMQGLFDDQYGDSRVTDATTLLLADILNSGKPSELRKVLAMYNKSAGEAAAGAVDLFNESGKPYTKEELLTTINERFRNATPKEQQALVESAIAENKRRAEEKAAERQRGGDTAGEQTPNADERGGERGEPTADEPLELEPLGKDRNDTNEDTPEEAALRSRIGIGDEWEEDSAIPGKPIYKRKLYIDGKHEIIQTDAPDKNGSYMGSQLTYDGRDFGDLWEIADYIDGKTTPATSDVNLNPTEAQKEAGNYKKGHVTIEGMRISIENPKYSIRSGKDADGTPWETRMTMDYGYIRGTQGKDKDHIDIFLSDVATEKDHLDEFGMNSVFVIDQYNKDGSFDEHKVVYGVVDSWNAKTSYLENYSSDWAEGRRIEVTEVPMEDFKKWAFDGRRKIKPFAEYKAIKALTEDADQTRTNVNADGMIVDEDGKPLTLYHGTPNKEVTSVSQLEPGHKRMGEKEPARYNGDGVSFTPEMSVAQDYAELSGHGKGRIFPANIRLKNPYYTLGVAHFTPEEAAAFTADIKAKGHDGIINYASKAMRESGALPNEVIAFDKSAIVPIKEESEDGWDYTITPTTYTNKKGKTSDVWLVKFDRDLSKEQKAALDSFSREPLTEGKKTSRGWYDRKEGGYMMRSEEAARQLAEMIGNEEAVSDAQPLTADELRKAVETPTDDTPDYKAVTNADDFMKAIRHDWGETPMVHPVSHGTMLQFAERSIINGRNRTTRQLGNAKQQFAEVDLYPSEEKMLKTAGFSRKQTALTLIDDDGKCVYDIVWHPNQNKGSRNWVGVTKTFFSPEKPKKAPINRVSLEDVMTDLSEKGETKLSDHAEPVKKEPETQHEISDDEMNSLADELRDLLGIGEDEGDGSIRFRDPGELTPQERQKIQSAGIRLAMGMIERGVTKFPDLATKMVAMLGDKIRPWLKSFYEGARWTPGYDKYEFTPSEEVAKFDVQNFDKPTYDPIKDAEMRVEERKAQTAAEQAEKELKETRNQQRKEDDKQREADTEALGEKADTVAGKAESLAETSEDERELNEVSDEIDETIDEINDQLALLGYYEADLDSPEHEVYGLRRSAEKKAVKDAVKLTKQLVDDLGIEIEKVAGKTTEQMQKSRGKNDTAVRANIAQVGGDITVNLPYPDGRNLHISIGLSPTHERGVEPNRGGGAWEGDNYEVDRIMFRFGDSHNHFLPTDVTYGKMLDEIQRAAKWGQPKKQEAPKAEPQEEAYHGTVTLKDGREAIVIVANHTETMGEPARLTDYIVGVKGEPGTIKISPEEIAHAGAPTADDIPSHAKEEESHNGYNRGDEVMWDRYGNGKWEKVKIEDFDADGSPIFESVKGIMSEKGDWSRVKPADGVFGEAQRVATKAQEDKKKAAEAAPSKKEEEPYSPGDKPADADQGGEQPTPSASASAQSDATEKAIEVLSGGKKKPAKKKKKEIKPEQPVGDLFGGLFDYEPETPKENEKRNGNKPSQELAGGERAHAVGEDETGTDGRVPTAGTEPTGKGGATDEKGAGVERGTDGATHGTDEDRGLQQSAGDRGRDESDANSGSAGNGVERGGTTGQGTEPKRETNGGGEGVSEGESNPGTGKGGKSASVNTKLPKPERKYTRNFRYGEEGNEADTYTPAQRLEANVKAIETLADVLFSGKPATDEQKAIISRFRGWGQVDLGKYYDIDHILRNTYSSNPLNRLAKAIQKLDPQGEKKLFNAIKTASLSSYYTPTEIAKAMNVFLSQAGFKGGQLLDPSMGNGVFEGTLRQNIQERTAITGVELDWLSGQLSRVLYPDANVIIGGFEKSGLTPGSFDVVTSNVPFGSIEVNDPTWQSDSTPLKRSAQKRIHNYYAVKMLELTRPGGLVSMMTSNAVMDSPSNQNIRAHIAEQGEIIGAIRLPDNTFQGTGATADIIFIRKWRDAEDRRKTREEGDYVERIETPFLSQHETTAPNKVTGQPSKVRYNGLYARMPELMIGEVRAGNQYSQEGFGLTSDLSTSDIATEVLRRIVALVGNRKGSLYNPTRTTREAQQAVREAYKGNGDWVSNGNLVIQDGKVGVLNSKTNEYGEVTREFEGTLKHDKMIDRVTSMIDVRTAMKKLIAGQIEGESDASLSKLRNELQKAYDTFTAKYGRLQDSKNTFILDDIDGYTLQALEKWKSGKFIGLSDIFTKNTIKPALRLDSAKTPQEAITTSLAEYGYVRPDYMEKTIGEDWADKCADFVFQKPNSVDDFVTRDEYLSGDVVSKLAEAKEAAKQDPRYERNVKALEEVQPVRIPFDDIAIHLGARWIPENVLNDFVKEIFGLHATARNRRYDHKLGKMVEELKSGVRYVPEIDSFEINIEKKELGGQAQDWETPRRSAKEILQAALEDKTIVVRNKDKEESVDEEQTELANQKVADMRERFEQWLPSDPERVNELEQAYNDRFNRIVIRKFDGSHLVVPGLMGMELRPHQKDAVWMLINNRGGIVDHIVGAGKTLVMQSAIMEMRRMGIAKKPMIVALKSTVSQIAREFKEAFPSARVLAPNDSDFQKENRKKFIANISLNDYDCVILSHEQYCMLPHTEEAERAVVNEQLWQLDNIIEYLYGTGDTSQMTKRQIKALETRRKNLQARLEKRLDRNVDREFCFENLGVDYLFVDECHQFKSLPYVTSYQNIAGLSGADGSNRAVALLTGVRHLQKMHQGDKGTIFLSGTTITNSLVEIYNLLNYLRPRELERLGMPTFDAWASTFAVHTSELEAGTTGEFKMKDRFRSFDNVPELSQLYAEIADVRNDTNLKLPKPAVDGRTVIVPQSDAMAEINREIVRMLQNKEGSYFGIHPKNPQKYPWGLRASTLSANAAVSPRLIFPDMEDDGGKVHAVCENVKKCYDEMSEHKGVQLIFCELGVPGKDKKYDAYTDIINRLSNDYGIPKEEIAYIQQAPTEEKRKDLFQRVRDGKVRILIGGTKNMGTGVNVQTLITDMHMLTVPWTPSSLEQCIGRGARQGNILARDHMNNKVRVHYYATEGSLDLYKYQLLDAKGKMFTQFKMGTVNGGRSFDEESADEDGNIDPAEMVAILSGNPVIFEKAKQEKAVKKLRALRNGFERDYQRKKAKYTELQAREERLTRLVRLNERDRADLAREGFKPDDKGVYPTKFTIMEGYSRYGGRTFDKPKEAGEYLLKMLEDGKEVTLQGFGQRAKIVTVNEEGTGGLFSSYRVLQIGDGERDIKYTVRLSDDPTAAGTAFRNLLKRIIDNGEVFKRDLDETKNQLAGMNIGDGVFPKQAELDEAVAKLRELTAEYNKIGKNTDEKEGNKYRLVEEGEELDWLESLGDDELVHVYRNVQILPDGSMASPMAAYNVETGEIRRLSPGRWNGPEERQIILTPEQEEKLAALKRDGYVINDKGKQEEFYQISKEMRFFKTKKEGVKLQFNLTRAGSKDMWADYNPYDHAIKVMLNDQFKAAWKRPNLVVVEAVMPKSEIEGGYKAPYAALPTGEHKWNNGRSLYLSRWSKIVRIVPFAEVAADIDRYWRENPSAYKGAKVTDYDRFQPQVREELEKLGYRFEDKGKRGELSEAELQKAYKSENATYITNEDIERMNAEMQEAWHETPATERALAPNPKSEAEAERLVMADRVEALADKLNTPVRIITNETELQAVSEDGKPRYSRRERRAKGWWSSKTGEVVVVLPNNVNVADVENTVVHEVVGHKGLRAFIGEERFDEFLGEVYDHASNPIRAKIDKETDRMVSEEADRLRERKRKAHERAGEDYNSTYYSDMAEARVEAEKKREEYRREATEEYMSDLGGRIGDEGFEKMSRDELTLWGKIKAKVQGFLDKFLKGLKIAKSIRLNDKDLSYILFKSWKNARERGVFAEAEDAVRRRKSGYDADAQTRFRDPGLGLEETITKMKTEAMNANTADYSAKVAAMRAIGGNLNHLRSAMARQREYDVATAKSIKDLARVLMENGLLDTLGNAEVKSLLAQVTSAIGRKDISKQADRVFEIMTDNHLRNTEQAFSKLISMRTSRADGRGIKVQGALDPDGEAILKIFNAWKGLSVDEIDGRIADAIDSMSDPYAPIAERATLEYAGLQIARDYAENVAESKKSEKILREEIKKAKEEKDAGRMTADAYNQTETAIRATIQQMKLDRISAYESLMEKLGGELKESVDRAKAWREAEKERVNTIHHLANSDMQGRELRGDREDTRLMKLRNSWLVNWLLEPMSTLDQMLKMFGSKNPNGEGYMQNHFMRGWIDAADKEQEMKEAVHKQMDEKAAEIFGKRRTWHNGGTRKVDYTYSDLYDYAKAQPGATIEYYDGAEMREYEIGQGELLYLYAVDKMPMGRATNRRMGIDDATMQRITDALDPKLKAYADWVQDELLPRMGDSANEVHKKMFGADMDAIDNYFPFVRDKDALKREVENGQTTQPNDRISVQTGAIKKRVASVAKWNMRKCNFMDVLAKHVDEMCHWTAFAELNRDFGTILSYNRLKQQVFRMNSVYGAGEQLWKRFEECCAIATDAYEPQRAKFDRFMVQGAKGVTMGKISLRAFTALKQTLSLPAFFGEVNMKYVAADLGTGGVKACQWAWKNMPNFRKRILSRTSGDYRLKENEYDGKIMKASSYGMLPNIGVDAWTIAVGSHGVYKTRKAKYLRWGMEESQAERRAVQDAEICYNKSQQSSEGPFMAPVQVDHTFYATSAMLFRNSSTSYTREAHTSARNLKRLISGEVNEDYVAKQILRTLHPEAEDAWTDAEWANARKHAKREIRSAYVKNTVNLAMFGWILPWLWRIGGVAPLLLLSRDDEEKQKQWEDAMRQSMFAPVEGLAYGDVISDGMNMLTGANEKSIYMLGRSNPMFSDIMQAAKKADKDMLAAANDVINIIGGMAFGVNPQTVTDWTAAIIDATDDRDTQREMALFVCRMLSVPQSQVEKIYFDELDMDALEASGRTPDELMQRYARYKMIREAPLTGWLRGEEERKALADKKAGKARTTAKERLNRRTDALVSADSMNNVMQEYETTKARVSEVNKVRKQDEERYYELLDTLENSPEFERYLIVGDYKREVEDLTKQWLRAKTTEERDSIAQSIVALKREMLKEVSESQ